MYDAFMRYDFDTIKYLLSLKKMIDVDKKINICISFCFSFGIYKNINWTSLHRAAQKGNVEILKYVISLNKHDIKSKAII